MKTRKRWSLWGFLLTIPFLLVIIGVVLVAPECRNTLQMLARVLFASVLVGTFAIIRKRAKQLKHNTLNK